MDDKAKEQAQELETDARKTREAELLALFKIAADHRLPYEEEALDDYKAFIAHRDEDGQGGKESSVDSTGKVGGRSNITLPVSFRILDTILSRVMDNVANRRPFVGFSPIPSVGQPIEGEAWKESEDKASKAAACVDMDFEKNDFEDKIYMYSINWLTTPGATMAIGWRHETRMVKKRVPYHEMHIDVQRDPMTGQPLLDQIGQPVAVPIDVQMPEMGLIEEETEETIWDNNEMSNVDFLDSWPDPDGDSDPDTWRFWFHRDRLTRDQIEQRLDWLKEFAGGTVYEINWDELAPYSYSSQEQDKWSRMNETGYSTPTGDSSIPKHLQKYEVLNYWEGGAHAIIVGRVLVYDGPNHFYRHGKIPAAFRPFQPLPGQVFGRSGAAYLRALQDELDTGTNQRIDVNSMIINRMWWVKDEDIDDAELVSAPHRIVHGEYGADFGEIAFAPPNPASYQDSAIIEKAMEDTLGVTAAGAGGNEPGDTTATEITMRNSNAGVRYKCRIKILYKAIKRMAMLMDLNNQQLMDQGKLVKFFDQQGVASWAQADPEEILGEHDYIPAGASDPSVNREIERMQFMQAVQGAGANPQMAATTKWDEVNREYWALFDFKDPGRFVMSQEEIMQQQMMGQISGLLQQLTAAGQEDARFQAERQDKSEQMAFDREKEDNRKAEAGQAQLIALLQQFMPMLQGQGVKQ